MPKKEDVLTTAMEAVEAMEALPTESPAETVEDSSTSNQLNLKPAIDVLKSHLASANSETERLNELANQYENEINRNNLEIQLLEDRNEEIDRRLRATLALKKSVIAMRVSLEEAIDEF